VEQRTQVVATMLLGAGLRVYAGGDHLCFFPPLTVSDAELEQAAKIVDET
jgi:adenosylmethionine-8-amino-7-oxononanoate aminotransferase